MIRDLMQGKLNLSNAPHEATYRPTAVPKEAPAPKADPAPKAVPVKETPAPKPVASAAPKEDPKEKSLDDIILDFLAQEQKERNDKK